MISEQGLYSPHRASEYKNSIRGFMVRSLCKIPKRGLLARSLYKLSIRALLARPLEDASWRSLYKVSLRALYTRSLQDVSVARSLRKLPEIDKEDAGRKDPRCGHQFGEQCERRLQPALWDPRLTVWLTVNTSKHGPADHRKILRIQSTLLKADNPN